MAPPGSSRPPSGAAAYKKKDGMLTMSEDRGSISWVPAAAGVSKNGVVKIEVGSITSMFSMRLFLEWTWWEGVDGFGSGVLDGRARATFIHTFWRNLCVDRSGFLS